MLFSGKITNSFLNFLTRQGADLEAIWDFTDLPTEFLRDPSSWIPAESVEKFLNCADKEFSEQFAQGPMMSLVGHQCDELRAWGVLDSVLKMMQKPQDIYSHPDRFISYFISPAPPVANFLKERESVSFDLPISNEEYPLVTEYLRAAFEALPKYQGRPMASVQWKQTRVIITWSEDQASFLGEEDLQPNIRPELVENLLLSLEQAQRDLESEKRRALDREARIVQLEGQVQKPFSDSVSQSDILALSDVEQIETNILKMRDYFSRAHQLVTLLIRQDRMDAQVKEAMRRVDWEVVGLQFPNSFSETLSVVRRLKKALPEDKQPLPEIGSSFRLQLPS